MVEKPPTRPFIMRFSVPIDELAIETLRFDEVRQVAQILDGREWIDTVRIGTRKTRVRQETTDDE
jgi:hypothetical protein